MAWWAEAQDVHGTALMQCSRTCMAPVSQVYGDPCTGCNATLRLCTVGLISPIRGALEARPCGMGLAALPSSSSSRDCGAVRPQNCHSTRLCLSLAFALGGLGCALTHA